MKDILDSLGADPVSQVRYLIQLRQGCMTGIEQEKVVNSKDGAFGMTVLERYPAVALAATREISRLYKEALGQQGETSGGLELTLTDLRGPEDD